MQTNIISFRNDYLIVFLKYQIKHNTKLWHYYKSWLLLNLEEKPSYYNNKHSKALERNQIILELSFWYFEYKCYLRINLQKKFEKIVAQSFDVIVYHELFTTYFDKKISETLNEIIYKYKINPKHYRMLEERFLRLRKYGPKARNKPNYTSQNSVSKN